MTKITQHKVENNEITQIADFIIPKRESREKLILELTEHYEKILKTYQNKEIENTGKQTQDLQTKLQELFEKLNTQWKEVEDIIFDFMQDIGMPTTYLKNKKGNQLLLSYSWEVFFTHYQKNLIENLKNKQTNKKPLLITNAWKEYLYQIEIKFQEQIYRFLYEDSPPPLVSLTLEDIKIISFIDKLDQRLNDMDDEIDEKKQILNEFVISLLSICGLEEIIVDTEENYDSRFHEHIGVELRKENEEGFLRVIKRGFRLQGENEIIRKPQVITFNDE